MLERLNFVKAHIPVNRILYVENGIHGEYQNPAFGLSQSSRFARLPMSSALKKARRLKQAPGFCSKQLKHAA